MTDVLIPPLVGGSPEDPRGRDGGAVSAPARPGPAEHEVSLPDETVAAGGPSRRTVLGMAVVTGTVAVAGVGAMGVVAGRDDAGVSRGRGTWTSTGTLAVTAVLWVAGRAPSHGHAGGATTDAAAGHEDWSEVLRTELEVHNGTSGPVALSPGQFRLVLPGRGVDVPPLDHGDPPAVVAAGHTVRTWTTFLLPAGVTEAALEFQDVGTPRATDITLPVLLPGTATRRQGSRG